MLKTVFNLHIPLLKRLLIADLVFTLVASLYVFGRGETFTWYFALPYLFTVFVLFLSVNISLFSNYCGSAQFYLMLPMSRKQVVFLFLFLRLASQALLLVVILFPISLLLKEDPQFQLTLLFQVLLFQGTIALSTLPVLSFLSRPHPMGILLAVGFFVSLIPAWIVTVIIQETFLEASSFHGIVSPLLFLILAFFISLKTIGKSIQR